MVPDAVIRVLRVGDVDGVLWAVDEGIDRVVLDMLAPWEDIEAITRNALILAGVLVCYVAGRPRCGECEVSSSEQLPDRVGGYAPQVYLDLMVRPSIIWSLTPDSLATLLAPA